MIYSNQIWFCNACGEKQDSPPSKAVGRNFRCCSQECHEEIEWKYTLSIMGQKYRPKDSNNNNK